MSSSSDDDVKAVLDSGFFDPIWYLEQYPDVARMGTDPAQHYLAYGARLLRNPSSRFDTRHYLDANGDVAEAKINPLLHYLRWGRQEGRPIYPADQINFEKRAVESRDFSKIVTKADYLARSVKIIIPVYNAAVELRSCIESVLRNTPASIEIIIIDDASTDRRIGELLAGYRLLPNVRVAEHETNLGFTQTVNHGIALAGEADVILLNSDTEVTPGWSRNLRIAVYSGDRVATATPFSDNAGAFSAPEVTLKNSLPAGLDLDQSARLVARVSARAYPAVPTGGGFCMYIRRDCLDQIGAFDAEAFPRGYGEENDFCMRATRAGWLHVIDDATFIHHVRSASFGNEKTHLAEAGMAILRKRYPEYDAAVRRFISDPGLRSIRGTIAEAWRAPDAKARARPRLLFVVSTREGGTPLTNEDLMAALDDRYETFLLRCDAQIVDLYAVAGRKQDKIESVTLADPVTAFPHDSASYNQNLQHLLVKYCIELIHIRHIAWHSLSLPNIGRKLGLPVIFSFHDFYTVCPTVKLLDENNQFCAGVCTSGDGDCKQQIWNDAQFPHLKHKAIHRWQNEMREMLSHCSLFVTTSIGAKQQIELSFPKVIEKEFVVVPHGRDLEMKDCSSVIRGDEKTIRILVAGNIDVSKGAAIIQALARYENQHRFEFHVLGNTILESSQNIVRHGKYEREDFLARVKQIRPHIGAILSIWPETFCHTLTEMWSCGLPVVGIDRGAVGERLRAAGGGWLSASLDPGRLFLLLQKIAADRIGYVRRQSEIKAWQEGIGRLHTTAWMSDQYDTLYRKALGHAA